MSTRITSLAEWRLIETVPHDRYVLLFSPHAPRWDGNMEVAKWYGDNEGCFWSCGGPNGGLELNDEAPGHHQNTFTHWMELPEEPRG